MTYLGTVRGGVVVFNGDEKPPEGTNVRVHLQPAVEANPNTAEQEVLRRQREGLLSLSGTAPQVLPADASINVDHYLYGMPKK